MNNEIVNTFINKSSNIIEWCNEKLKLFSPPFYTSVDLRDAGYKIAPIDTNVFPAGFNNLNDASTQLAKEVIRDYLKNNYPECKKILIFSENHTRNTKYIDNLIALKNVISSEYYTTEIGNDEIQGSYTIESHLGETATIHKIIKSQEDNKIKTSNNFIPDLIVINNDMISGMPSILENITTQIIVPSTNLGWFKRKKSQHFKIYLELVNEFCKEFKIDPWLISTITSECNDINFTNEASLEYIANETQNVLTLIADKFTTYNINSSPSVFIKANNGTYGLGIIKVSHVDEIFYINKKLRNKMKKTKGNTIITSVLLQEGIPTNETFSNHTAEPLIYYLNRHPVGYLYRYNANKDNISNLNSVGAQFTDISQNISPNKKMIWQIISTLSVIAAAIESHNVNDGVCYT